MALIEENPAVLRVLQEHGVHFCPGCYLTLSASLEKAAAWHAVPDLARFLRDIERALHARRGNGAGL